MTEPKNITKPVPLPTHRLFKDLTGMRFGRLTVLFYAGKRGRAKYWRCLCDCGSYATSQCATLKDGGSKSCGCLKIELCKSRSVTHGLSNSKIHQAYTDLMRRCYNEKHPRYYLYGGRGIYVCEEWKRDFMNFVNDMGIPKPNQSIDRIDNNGNYEPSNCRWTSQSQQIQNSRIAKLNAESVIAMRLAAKDGCSIRSINLNLAPHVGIGTVRNAVTGRTWKNIRFP